MSAYSLMFILSVFSLVWQKPIYFVVESSIDTLEIIGAEYAKIHCARAYFKVISGKNVIYDLVKSYQALLDKVMK